MKTAFFTSMLAIEFDPEQETPEEALESYLGDTNVAPSYELTGIESDDDNDE
jgi:hypothetical protein